ncbi:UDP-N-acetylglucosamine transferase subunit ALG14 homolog [Nematostella vectensis]|uniref:UDP-N-acetylglucosamine transferase subunit ALG14 homolog n=1 Tax=Nematostella vectensis TaxID=45351 RepID=UPI0013901E4D|nr:UDP-N-acetylglucosamine transferase subunit ALG14 homolog [Nematostella vectensis]
MAVVVVFCCCVLLALFIAAFARIWWVLGRRKMEIQPRSKPVKTLIVMGSGGHTSEMIRLMSGLSDMYNPRMYLIADTDKMSEEKVVEFESKQKPEIFKEEAAEKQHKDYEILRIPRSREVKQTYVSSVLTTLYAFKATLPLVHDVKPDLILCNGPGTCVPVCIAAVLLKILGMHNTTLVYIESVCRVKTLSLSGLIMYRLADHFMVQWQKLQDAYPKAVFLGRLV